MNREAQDFTRGHYDGHANRHETQAQAQHARRRGPGLPLKEYHNLVKRLLIQRFAKGVDSLLDLACGRGGDIWKWIDAKIGYVKGLDLSPGEIQEAQTRFAEAGRKRRGLAMGAEFEATEDLGRKEVKLDREFDVVTCMFAIHYFFASSQSLDCFLHNVAINLKEGGYFFGACPDGSKVNETIKTFGRWPSYTEPMLTLHARWEGSAQNFGSGYTCAIGDTVTEGHGDSTGSYEYLVFRSTLVGAAKRHGLVPVIDYQNTELEELFVEADRVQACKHFNPRFPVTGNERVDVSLKLASKLNMAFCFRKKTLDLRSLPDAGTKRGREASGGPAEPSSTVRQTKRAMLSTVSPAPSPGHNTSFDNLSQHGNSSRASTPNTASAAPNRSRTTKIG